MSIRLAKLAFFAPANDSRATLDISAPDKVVLSDLSVSMENRVTIPMPPTQAVDIRHSCRPFGKAYMSFKIEAPVVVKPDTLSKMALMGVNSPP